MVVLSRLESDDVFQPTKDEVCVFSLAGGLAVIGKDNRVYDVVQTEGQVPACGVRVARYRWTEILEIRFSHKSLKYLRERPSLTVAWIHCHAERWCRWSEWLSFVPVSYWLGGLVLSVMSEAVVRQSTSVRRLTLVLLNRRLITWGPSFTLILFVSGGSRQRVASRKFIHAGATSGHGVGAITDLSKSPFMQGQVTTMGATIGLWVMACHSHTTPNHEAI